MHPVPIGARRRRFVIERPVDQPDGFGGLTRSFAPGPEIWGAIELVEQGERLRADREEAAATHRVHLRYREDVTGDMRLTSGIRRFAIRSAVDPDGRGPRPRLPRRGDWRVISPP